ncbi:MAG: acyl-CoA reductase [Chitinophagaceae bacterium]|nr:acyl-CoA reductase [Chitinophagaceae bacterium]
MDLQERIELLAKLGEYMKSNSAEWQEIKQKASRENPWFIPAFIERAAKNIYTSFLEKESLEKWAQQYAIPHVQEHSKTVGVVMAGNIPLVGFHDFLSVFISGHSQVIKASSKDEVLIKHLVKKLYEWDHLVQNDVSFAEQLKGCDAYIATGSNNTGRYFEYYFGKYPNIIRKNRTSVAILTGSETTEDLSALADDIQVYFGLGCRNVTKLFVPEGYDFEPLVKSLNKYEYLLDFHKYKHNYDYQLALVMLNRQYYMTNGSVLLIQNDSVFAPVSRVNYSFYQPSEDIAGHLKHNERIQCIVGKNQVPFGDSQHPKLTDYADGTDTLQFLCSL